jgi:DNA polymerase sigma
MMQVAAPTNNEALLLNGKSWKEHSTTRVSRVFVHSETHAVLRRTNIDKGVLSATRSASALSSPLGNGTAGTLENHYASTTSIHAAVREQQTQAVRFVRRTRSRVKFLPPPQQSNHQQQGAQHLPEATTPAINGPPQAQEQQQERPKRVVVARRRHSRSKAPKATSNPCPQTQEILLHVESSPGQLENQTLDHSQTELKQEPSSSDEHSLSDQLDDEQLDSQQDDDEEEIIRVNMLECVDLRCGMTPSSTPSHTPMHSPPATPVPGSSPAARRSPAVAWECDVCGKTLPHAPTPPGIWAHQQGPRHKHAAQMLEILKGIAGQGSNISKTIRDEAEASLTAPIQFFFRRNCPTDDDMRKREYLRLSVERIIRSKWPDATLHMFGSSANNLYFRDSDVDLCLMLNENRNDVYGNPYSKNDAREREIYVIRLIAKLMHRRGMHDVLCLIKSRVPILKKQTTIKLGFKFDLCVERPLGLHNSALMQRYTTLDPRMRPLAFTIKAWSKAAGINNPQAGLLSSYCVYCMLIYYLQTRSPPILPNLQLNRDSLPQMVVSGYNCAFEWGTSNFYSKNTSPLGNLLLGFFQYYGYEFDYSNSVVSIRLAKEGSLPPKSLWDQYGWKNSPMCVEDPFEVDHNLARLIHTFSLQKIIYQFRVAYVKLCTTQNLNELWRNPLANLN